MAHFAQISADGIVQQVIVVNDAEAPDEATGQAFIASIGLAGTWKQTSYNTHGNVHNGGGIPLRKNYAGVGFTYDPVLDAFIPPKPSATATLNTTTGLWS